VLEILANGNLMVRGEKKLGLSEGTEVIQVSGVIRPEDVGPISTVQSTGHSPGDCTHFGGVRRHHQPHGPREPKSIKRRPKSKSTPTAPCATTLNQHRVFNGMQSR
jgi:hypothetical protein